MEEVEIGAAVADYFRRDGYTVYGEVGLHGRTCDAVAKRGDDVIAIECKVSLSSTVVGQALRWCGWANMVVVAIGSVPRKNANLETCHRSGIGVIQWDGERINMLMSGKRIDRVRNGLANALHPYLLDNIPGSQTGMITTRWGHMRDQVIEYIAANPGCTAAQLGELEVVIDYYGRRGASRVRQWIVSGAIPAEVQRHERRLRFYPKGHHHE